MAWVRSGLVAPLLCASALLAGCGSSGDVADFKAAHTPQWSDLEDGSKFARMSFQEGRNDLAIRCWPGQRGQFTCLRVGKFNDLGSYSVSVDLEDALPDLEIGVAIQRDGYSCAYVLGYTEAISRGGDTLVSTQPGAAIWRASYVENYMRDNQVAGQRYYRCLDIARAVVAGSLETVGTSSITRAMLE